MTRRFWNGFFFATRSAKQEQSQKKTKAIKAMLRRENGGIMVHLMIIIIGAQRYHLATTIYSFYQRG